MDIAQWFDQWYVLYIFITFTIGIFSIGIATVTCFKTKDRLIRYYLYFYLAFTLLVIANIFFSYLLANFPELDGDSSLFTSQRYIERIAILLLTFTMPVLTHYVFSVTHQKLKNGIIGVIIIVEYGISLGFGLAKVITGEVFDLLTETLLFVIVLYSFLSGIYFSRRLQDSLRKRYAQKLMIFLGISLIVSLEDIFLGLLAPIDAYPVLYCGFGVVFSHHFIKHYLHHPQVSSETFPAESVPAETIFAQYGLSPREQDVLVFLLQGYANAKIGETLCISLSTVKAHIRSIFQKCAVNNRYELITMFKHVTLPSSQLKPDNDRAEDAQ